MANIFIDSGNAKQLTKVCPSCGSISIRRKSRRQKGELHRGYCCRVCGESFSQPSKGSSKYLINIDVCKFPKYLSVSRGANQ
jgi:transposase-like protein